MQKEIESRFYPIDKEKLIKLLKLNGAKLIHGEFLMKRITFLRKNNDGLKCDMIRIRNEGEGIKVSAKSYKKDGAIVLEQFETQVEIYDFDKMVEIFTLAGLNITRNAEGYREKWVLKDCEIVIDLAPGLDYTCEIEGRSEDLVSSIAQLLEIEHLNVNTSNINLYCAKYGLDESTVDKMLDHCTFDNNPFTKL